MKCQSYLVHCQSAVQIAGFATLSLFVLLRVFCPAAHVTEFAAAFDVFQTKPSRTPQKGRPLQNGPVDDVTLVGVRLAVKEKIHKGGKLGRKENRARFKTPQRRLEMMTEEVLSLL